MTGFAGWVGGNFSYQEMKHQLKKMGSFLGPHACDSVYLPAAGLISTRSQTSTLLQNGSAALSIIGDIYLDYKGLSQPYRLKPDEILESYLHQGAQCLNSFSGQFALCIVLSEHDEVFLACDHFSTTPLYYYAHHSDFVFSSSCQALIQHKAVPTELSNQSLYDYLYFHNIPTPQTVYKNVHRVDPGHYILHRRTKTINISYWQPEAFATTKPPFSQAKEELHHLLKRSVSQGNGTKTGAFLSGGLDSSTLVGILANNDRDTTHAFTIGFDDAHSDESAQAKMVANHFGVKHDHRIINSSDLLQALPKLIQGLDQPFGNASLLGTYFCAELAQSKGIECLIAGDGGDELFGGNVRYLRHQMINQYRSLPKWLRSVGLEWWADKIPPQRAPFMLQKVQKLIHYSKISLAERDQSSNLLMHLQAKKVLSDRFLERIQSEHPMKAYQESQQSAQSETWLGKLMCMDLKWILADNDLFKVHTACNLNGISVRYPFLDNNLVAFALQLPDSYKLKDSVLRPFYKKAMHDFLPKQIIQKKKHGFGVPFGLWLTQDVTLRDYCFESLNQLKNRDIIQSSFIDELKNTLIPSHPGYYGVMAWMLMVLEQWLQVHCLKTQSVKNSEQIRVREFVF